MDDADALRLRLRLLPDPPLWTWELVDRHSGQVLRSSWDDDWTAYESPDSALRAARATLRRSLAVLEEPPGAAAAA